LLDSPDKGTLLLSLVDNYQHFSPACCFVSLSQYLFKAMLL